MWRLKRMVARALILLAAFGALGAVGSIATAENAAEPPVARGCGCACSLR